MDYQSKPIKEAGGATSLWDFAIQIDRKIKRNWPDVMVKNYKS